MWKLKKQESHLSIRQNTVLEWRARYGTTILYCTGRANKLGSNQVLQRAALTQSPVLYGTGIYHPSTINYQQPSFKSQTSKSSVLHQCPSPSNSLQFFRGIRHPEIDGRVVHQESQVSDNRLQFIGPISRGPDPLHPELRDTRIRLQVIMHLEISYHGVRCKLCLIWLPGLAGTFYVVPGEPLICC